jgi:hypothetical protein
MLQVAQAPANMQPRAAKTAHQWSLARALPYVLSWAVLGSFMLIGMTRLPLALYTPLDGQWAKWNAEAILHFSKVLDLSPYSMLAGMGSMYFPNLPWLNPGALAVGLPFDGTTTNIISYAVYAAELAISIVLLARTLGFSWPIATAAAQLHIYLLFPPFSKVFHIYDWYSLAPYYAHLLSALNAATAAFLACGHMRDWRGNLALCIAFFLLFISGLLSAPFTFVFASPAFVAISAVIVLARRPSGAEWAWKAAALALCLLFFFGSGLLDYYLGTMATAGRTPTHGVEWSQLFSPSAWLELLRTHPLCRDARLLLCTQNRGAWLEIAALVGAAAVVLTRGAEMRVAAATFIAYVGVGHLYAYAYQAAWLGPVAVFSSHFMMLSSWSFMSIFAVVPFFELFRLIRLHAFTPAKRFGIARLVSLLVTIALAALLAVIVYHLLAQPYGAGRYRFAQIVTGGLALGGVLLAVELTRAYWGRRITLGPIAALSVFPILAFVHSSMNVREGAPKERDPSLRNYLEEKIAIDVGKPFRGYAATIWLDKDGSIWPRSREGINDSERYITSIPYFRTHYGDTFTYVDLWKWNVPTFEEYGEWTSVQAHAFAARLLATGEVQAHSNYLRAFDIDADLLRALGIRFVLTDAAKIEASATLRGSTSAPRGVSVYLFELPDVNLATYSPTRFIRADTADAIVQRIKENKNRLDQVAVVSADIAPTTAQARNAEMIIERDGVRVRAASDGPAHLLLPIQFSHCLVVVNGAPVRLNRANLFQTLMSFEGAVEARIEFQFGLFADNKCRLRDGLDNKALGLTAH